MIVQVFGIRRDPGTRHALRFFAERRIQAHFVDLVERPASRRELLRFVQKFGVAALVNRDGRRFAELGLGAADLGSDRWVERLEQEPLLLRMPLVRFDQRLTIGADEASWRAWTDR